MASLAIALALAGLPELVSLYNENKISSARLLRQQNKEPLHAAQAQVRSSPEPPLILLGTKGDSCVGPCLCIMIALHPERIAFYADISFMLTTEASPYRQL